MNRLPARGRVESLCFIVVADDMNVRQHVGDFVTSSVETKTIIPFSRIELDSGADHRFVRNRMVQSLFARDLFDISQALVETRTWAPVCCASACGSISARMLGCSDCVRQEDISHIQSTHD
jgi:hypothetical protein